MFRLIGAFLFAFVGLVASITGASAMAGTQHIAIPSYIYPGAAWTQMAQANPTVGLTIINPNSGPGTTTNTDYSIQVKKSQAAGLSVLGYVHTSYANGTVPLATAEAEVDEYYSWYDVDGIFFDEASTDCGVENSYYLPLYNYVKAKGGKAIVVLNPGTATDLSSCYLYAADILVTFEGDFTTYTGSTYSQPSWVASASPSRIWHLVYNAPNVGAMLTAVNLSKQRNAGWVFVTPGQLPNPWGALPTGAYWGGEIAAVNAGPGLVNVQTNAGAKGDGTTDDTSAFQNGFQLLGSAGGVLYVPSATYLIHPLALAVPSNVAVVGDSATLKNGVLGFSLFDVQSGASNVGATGLIVDGNNLSIRGMTVGSGATSVFIANDTFQNFTQPADSTSSLYYDVPAGIRIEGNGSGVVIDSTTVQNVVAINTNGPSWPHKVARGIWLDAASGQSIAKNVTIRNGNLNNVAPKGDGDCIVIQDSTETADLTIDNNTFNNCHKRAIKIQVPGVTVTNNHITNPFLSNNLFDTYPGTFPYDMYSAISVYASNVTVAGNTISGVGSFYVGIDVGSAPCTPLSGVAIQNNSLQSGSATKLSSSSVRAFAPINGFTVTDNTLAYATYGITEFPGSSNVTSIPNAFGPDITTQVATYGTPCDTTPPTTTASATILSGTGPASYSFGSWTNQPVTVTLSASDNAGGSGVAATYYQFVPHGATAPTNLLPGSWVTYASGFGVPIGDNDLYAFSVDNAGNAESPVNLGELKIDQTPPIVSSVVVNPVPLNTAATLTGTVTDPSGANGAPSSAIAAATYTVDGGTSVAMSPQAGSSFNAPSVPVTASIPGFSAAGVHNVCVTGTDAAGNDSASQCALLAVYDPSAGFVTGGGWITSPAGAYVPNPSLTGRASFGFVSKYQTGASVPTGETQFQFQVANLVFHSTSYQWLVISGPANSQKGTACKAQYKGSGALNGQSGYDFLLTAIDGETCSNPVPDSFRIQISDPAGSVVYDNQLSAPQSADPTTTLGGGDIQIHTQ